MDGLAKMIEGNGWPAPTAMAYVAKLSELIGGLMVALGVFTRWASLVCAFTMGTAVYMTVKGICANPDKVLSFGDIELASLYLVAFLALMFTGAGCLSIDYLRRPRTAEDDEFEIIGMPDSLDDGDGPVLDSLDRPAARPAPTATPPIPPATPGAGSTGPGRGRSGE